MHKTDGQWDPNDEFVYFLAAQRHAHDAAFDITEYVLLAVNDLINEDRAQLVEPYFEDGKKVLLDSGVYWLANEHAKKHGIGIVEALRQPPESLANFNKLYTRYLQLIDRWRDRLWGFIEFDAGGREEKKRVRAQLHEAGYNPIPVYHPLNDGWDYFDELAEQYDRICIGNINQASREVRRRLLSTLWTRRKAYPDLWIHLLGITPCNLTNAYPVDSCDSSSWFEGTRWGTAYDIADNHTRMRLRSELMSVAGNEKSLHRAVTRIEAKMAVHANRNWKNKMAHLRALGISAW